MLVVKFKKRFREAIMHGDDNWMFGTFTVLSKNEKILEIINDSNMIRSSMNSLVPNECLNLKTVTNPKELKLVNYDLAIVVLPEELDPEWQEALQEWQKNKRIAILKESELPRKLSEERCIDELIWLVHRAMINLPR